MCEQCSCLRAVYAIQCQDASSAHIRVHCSHLGYALGVPEEQPTPRQRARAAVLSEIKQAARGQLAERGAAALSVREVARELRMSSSGVYRYFSSRDELLTALIVDAYDALGAAVELAEAGVERADLLGRWRAAAHAVRDWARSSPQEYGLVFGSPVPGYAAPQDTIGPAARVPLVLAGILRDAAASGRAAPAGHVGAAVLDPSLIGAVAPLHGLPEGLVVAGLLAWSSLFGVVSFELFGHLVGSVRDHDAYFVVVADRLASSIGIGPAG